MENSSFLTNRTKAALVATMMVFAGILTHIPLKDLLQTSLSSSWTEIEDRSVNDSTLNRSSIRIAVIGAAGYIGARLMTDLPKERNWTVIGYDRIFRGQASYEISTRVLRRFQVVIYLGGLTGRAMCRDRPNDVERENIVDIHTLAQRMLPSQLLIFASTSAITEGSGSVGVDEDVPAQTSLLDSYSTSLLRREQILRRLASSSKTAPRMIGLRFGTVIGLSASQRIDLAPMALVCQAFLTGRLHVSHPESNRAFLSMEDLMRAITTVVKRFKQSNKFDIYHLQSFPASISNLANTIASLTGAHVDAQDHLLNEDNRGFSLKTTKFCTTFNFTFETNIRQVISGLIADVPRLCLGRQSRIDNGSIPCVVCGSRTMYTVLDLHDQPLANDFRTNLQDSKRSKRFPLRLVRCPVCYHTQLSYIVDRNYLFSHYLYQSGTSRSLQDYFAWLAEKTIKESALSSGTVLEIACNDGTQLNEFRKRGWKTIGVDPAKNLASIARGHGHTIYTGFWGVDHFPSLATLDSLDIIIAQNVLAHVDNPIQFLRACTKLMHARTKLYIQTSQCEMYDTGQFDTVYHEHVSFFTAHSFKKIADAVGLTIVQFEITPIHGRSCLVTFQRLPINSSIVLAPSLSMVLEKEQKLGMNYPWFYVKYQAQAYALRQWIRLQLASLQARNHTLVAYGAAAKGMVLLHFLLEMNDRPWNISFVVDDAPLKQSTFCPGTSIPVRSTTDLSKLDPTNPLTIIVFAWNFREEILKKIASATTQQQFRDVFLLFPFPQQQLLKMDRNGVRILAENPIKPLFGPMKSPTQRRPVLLITHFFNEEFLLPFWIRHHSSMFDMAILIDYNSTDQSVEIIRREAPPSWTIVSSRNSHFAADQVDREVNDYEKMYPEAWKIALTIPEFLVCYHLRDMLSKAELTEKRMAFRFRSIIMSGNDSIPLRRFSSLLKQRSQYTYNPASENEKLGITQYSRYLHRYQYGRYNVGRHALFDADWKWATDGFIAKYQYTPWPEIISRKLQIRARMSQTDFALMRGLQHKANREQLQKQKDNLQSLPQPDLHELTALNEELAQIHRLWKEWTNE